MDLQVEGSVAAILEPSLPAEVSCFSVEGFQYFLRRELAESNRYGHFAAFAMFRVRGPGGGEQVARLVRCLGQSIRATDFIGKVSPDTVGIILQHATTENALRVLSRLHEEVSRSFPICEKDTIEDAVAVFPTEANTLESLTSLAQQRLNGHN